MACSARVWVRSCNVATRTFPRQLWKMSRANYVTSRSELIEIYNTRKKAAAESIPASDMAPEAIYANNEMSLSKIEVIGFDYDYTLATYTPALHELLFDLGIKALVNSVKYPSEIMKFKFDQSFAVRGLHFDTQKGLLMKIDSFHNIQLGTVYRGLQPVPDDEVMSLYGGTHISLDYMNSFYGAGPMHQMIDLFAIPEIYLISHVTEYFNQEQIVYDPEYVFYDIRNAVQGIHKSGILHQKIIDNLDLYLEKTQETKVLLQKLQEEGKNLFLISNSGFPFIDAGMKFMVGQDWLDLFDIVIVNARKPKFFHAGNRPFRMYDQNKETNTWGRVTSLDKGKIYQQGNLYTLRQMTGWFGPQVLYFGDHVYSDLADRKEESRKAKILYCDTSYYTRDRLNTEGKEVLETDPSLRYGWRTGAIIPELEREVQLQNNPEYKAAVRWLVLLQHLIEDMQHQQSPESKQVIAEWLEERDRLRLFTKSVFNPCFGSLFRTYHNPTYFFRRLARFADIYTSSLTNMLSYPSDYTFYPHRVVLPHEPSPYETHARNPGVLAK